MEKEKYYTPSIDEFHVGFEYEKFDERVAMYSNYPKGCDITNWHRFKYDLKSIRLSQLGTHLYEKTIRVKYLDREDIESFGFKVNDTNLFGKEKYLFRGEHKVYVLKTEHLFYFIEHLDGLYEGCDNKVIVSIYNKETMILDEYPAHLFNGKIKNKSELSRLLKQLSII